MKTKWMCMILMFALALNLLACGNRQENGYSSENNVIKLSGHENTQEKEGKCTLSKLSDIRKRN